MKKRQGFEYVNYEIYQMEMSDKNHGKVFFDIPREQTTIDITEDQYKLVYNNGFYVLNDNDDSVLNKLYEMFNINHPKDYKGRSLSVSDIVRVERNFYVCQGIGWKQITPVNMPEEYL